MAGKTKRIRRSKGEQIGYIFVIAFLIAVAFSTIYPFWHVLMYSFSNSKRAISGGLFFWPRGFSLESYRVILKTAQIWISYKNSILVTLIGTLIAVTLSSIVAWPLAHRNIPGRRGFTIYILITMLFSGGMIPTYLVVSNLGLINSLWSMIIPSCLSAYNTFILRNYMQNISPSLEESAKIDGANDATILLRIILPLSKPALAAIAMFYGLSFWKNYMNCLLYTNKSDLQVLPLYLRSIMNSSADSAIAATNDYSKMQEQTVLLTEESIKMTCVAVSVIPILIAYPYLQRYYTSGLMVGAVKG